MSKRREIRNLLFVIGSAIASAFVLVALMLVTYNPTGRYLAKNVLLSPEIFKQILYPETDARTGLMVRYEFDSFAFAFYDGEKKGWQSSSVTPQAYQEFYKAVAEDQSILSVSQELRTLFKENPSTLTVHMRQNSGEKKTFQEVHFAGEGDYYRVQLRIQESQLVGQEIARQENWAYFFHPGIERYARAVFYP